MLCSIPLRFFALSGLVSLALPQASSAQTNLIGLASDGAWTWYNDPRALWHGGVLFFGSVRQGDGKTVLSAFDPRTGATSSLWASELSQKDDHNVPGLLAKQDGGILAIYARHGTDPFFAYRHSTGANPDSPATWSAEQRTPSSRAGLTYANPFQLAAESGRIFNFTRNLNFNPTLYTSTNGGVNWSEPRLFIHAGGGRVRPYVKYSSDFQRRIDFLYTDGHPRDVTNSLYHLYYQDGVFHETDGAPVKKLADLPLEHDAGDRGSVIYQYSDADSVDPNDHIPTGRAWCWEIARPSSGQPVCVFTVQRDLVAGREWSDDRIFYYYARWTGIQWQKRFIAQAGRPLYPSEDDYAGGICLDPQDPKVIYISSNAAEPFNLEDIARIPLRENARYELWRGVTGDGGLTFRWTAVTKNSEKDNLRPYVPRRQGGPPSVLWFRGTYRAYTNYDCEIVGLF